MSLNCDLEASPEHCGHLRDVVALRSVNGLTVQSWVGASLHTAVLTVPGEGSLGVGEALGRNEV